MGRRSRSHSSSRGARGKRSRSGKEKVREKDKDRKKDRDHEKEKDRDREKGKDRDREKEKEKDRGKEKEKEKEKDRRSAKDRKDREPTDERGESRPPEAEPRRSEPDSRGEGREPRRSEPEPRSDRGRSRSRSNERDSRRLDKDDRRRDEDRRDDRRRDDDRRRREDDSDRRRRDDDRRRPDDDDRRRRDDDRRRSDDDTSRRREEERSQREEEKKRKEDERRRHEEELQRRRDEKRRREEEERKKYDEERRKEREVERKHEEERRHREEEDRKEELEKKRREEWRRHEELLKLKEEDERKRQDEEAKRRDEEAKVLRQQQATLAVLRVLQKLSNANPDNFEALSVELDQVLQTELPETGPQQEILKAEADRVLEYAKQYVEQVRDQQRKWEELRAQQQQKVQDQEKNARTLIEDLGRLVARAEQAAERAHQSAAPLCGEGTHDMDTIEVLRISRAVEQAGKAAMSACSACADFLVQKRPVVEEAENIKAESTNAITALQPRIQQATRQATEALSKAKEHKDRIARKIASSKRQEKKAALFKRFDKDGDGLLNRDEVCVCSREAFGFELPKDNLDRICRQLFRYGRKGLDFADFQLLKTAIGIARDEERGKDRRVKRLEQEKQDKIEAEKRRFLVEEKKTELATTSSEVLTALGELEPKIQGAELDAESLSNESNKLKIEELKEKAGKVEASIEAVKAQLKSVQDRVQSITSTVSEMPELVEAMRQELTSLSSKADMQNLRLVKAQGSVAKVRQWAWHQAFAEYEALRMEVAAKLRVCIEAKGGKAEDLFQVISGDDSGELTKDEIRKFLEEHMCEIESEKLDALFPSSSSSSAGREAGLGPAKDVDAKAEKGAEAEKPVGSEESKDGDERAGEDGGRRDDSGEAGKGDDSRKDPKPKKNRSGPLISKEDFMRVVRIFYKVVKEIVLSDNLLIEQSGQIRRMDLGEVMEVFQGPMLDPSVGVYRIHGRALKDGIVGWVTVAGNQGITFLLPGGNVFKVVKPTPLTEELKDVEGQKPVRMLNEGDVLEVVDWARTSRSALGVTRLKAKIQGDDAVGWATVMDKDGAVFLEAN
mmetsp:Transcript_92815/g.286550  ORF Transcript_92815/g.286550 Transcript_92815/m.286550 type:complete len:1071 (-) Transcript_92815:116-3328(-)